MFDAHINVEYCNAVKSIHYICKYVHKGSDQNIFGLKRDSETIDEVAQYQLGRYICSNEVFWRIMVSRYMTETLRLCISVFIWKMANVCTLVPKLFTIGEKIHVILHSLHFFSYAKKTDSPKHVIIVTYRSTIIGISIRKYFSVGNKAILSTVSLEYGLLTFLVGFILYIQIMTSVYI